MVWSCITWYGPGWIVDVGRNMDKYVYLSVLQDDLTRTISYYANLSGVDKSDFIFMQDNDPKHKSNIVMEWLQNQDFSIIEWPAQSPDLNPIENMWVLPKIRLFKDYKSPPAGINDLWERTSQTWYSITVEDCRNCIKNMPKRCKQVLERNGLYSDY